MEFQFSTAHFDVLLIASVFITFVALGLALVASKVDIKIKGEDDEQR